MLLKNKKADEKFLSPWLFLIWTLVIVGISIGAVIFYRTVYDVRFEETKILNTRVLDCFITGAKLNSKILEKNFDIFSTCNFNESSLKHSGLFYLNINITNSSNTELSSIRIGNSDLRIQAGYRKEEAHLAICSSESMNALHNDELILINIISCSNNLG